MSADFTNDLFSSYLDDEATLAERAAVERELAASAEARRFLSDLSELSRELQSLPRKECPSDFSLRVMNAVEAGRCEAVPDRTESGTRRAGWLRNGAALAATAAALLLALNALSPSTPSRRGSQQSERGPAKAADALADVRSDRLQPVERKKVQRAVSRRPVEAGHYKRPELAGRLLKEPLVPPIQLEVGKKGNSRQGLVFVDDLQKITGRDIGRVLTAIEHSPRGISVVKLTVVDCRQGLDALQVLLSRNRIHRAPGELDTKPDEANAAAAAKPAAGRLVAVFVQSTSDRLASVMSELKSNGQFRRLQVDRPISPDRLDARTQFQIAMLDPLGGEDFSQARGAKRGRRFAFRSATRQDRKDAQKGKQPAPKHGKSVGSVTKSVAELNRISTQLQLTVPAGLFDRESKGVFASRTSTAGNQSQAATTPGNGLSRDGKRKPASTPSPGRPLRVLFVLVGPPAPASPAGPVRRKTGS